MCVIAVMKGKLLITKEQFDESIACNPDGVGVMYTTNDGKIMVWKGIESNYDPVWRMILQVREDNPDQPIVFHARIATHGSVANHNCHPFVTDDSKVGVMHNGVFRFTNIPEGMSDTQFFTESIISRMDEGFMDSSSVLFLLEEMAKRHSSKVVLLQNDGHVEILNEGAGHWHLGIWWSNGSYRPATRSSWSSNRPISLLTAPEDKPAKREYRCHGIMNHKVCCVTMSNPRFYTFYPTADPKDAGISIPMCRRCYKWTIKNPHIFRMAKEALGAETESKDEKVGMGSATLVHTD